MSAAEQAMNYDLAIEIINLMKMLASKQKDKATTEEERKTLEERIDMYCYEEGVLTGRNGNEKARASLYDKVFRLYSPIIKATYANL